MTKKLLYKELTLASHPTLYIFSLMGAMVLIPNYPYGTVFLYACIAPYITFMYGRETGDAYYTALLPVNKRDVVRAKCALLCVVQLGGLAFSVPFALLRAALVPWPNPVGIEANVALYGFGLVIYAVFNLVFLTSFYKTGYKAGGAFIRAAVPVTVLIVAMEGASHVPALAFLDSTEGAMLARQLPVLAVGIAVYAGALVLAYRISAVRFERVDL